MFGITQLDLNLGLQHFISISLATFLFSLCRVPVFPSKDQFHSLLIFFITDCVFTLGLCKQRTDLYPGLCRFLPAVHDACSLSCIASAKGIQGLLLCLGME